jgi:hypothetical protein
MDTIRPRELVPDPYLTPFANVYGTGGSYAADELFPTVTLPADYVKTMTYRADQLNDEVEALVPPSGVPNQVRNQPPVPTTIAMDRYGLNDSINDETNLLARNALSREEGRVRKLVDRLRLGTEKRIKALIDAAGTSGTPTPKWDAIGAELEANLDVQRTAFGLRTGYEANTLAIGAGLSRILKRDAGIRLLRKDVDSSLLVNGDLPPILWGLRTMIPGALVNVGNPRADYAQSLARVWGDATAYLMYIDMSAADTDGLTLGKQYRWAQWPNANYAVFRWRDPDLSAKKTWMSVEFYGAEGITCADCVYRFTSVLT